MLGVGELLEMLIDALVIALGDPIKRIQVVEVDVLLVFDEPLFAFRQPLGDLLGQALLACHELGIAAEQDVGAAAGHVRRDGHGSFAARLRDELSLLRVILRVQHDVLVRAAAS